MREVNPDVDALVALHVNVGLRKGLILAVLQLRDKHIIGPGGWDANPKLAAMVGKSLPAEFFLPGAAQPDVDPVHRMAGQFPDGPKDQRVVAGPGGARAGTEEAGSHSRNPAAPPASEAVAA